MAKLVRAFSNLNFRFCAKAVADKTPDQIDGAVKQAADMAKDTVDKVADEAEKTD